MLMINDWKGDQAYFWLLSNESFTHLKRLLYPLDIVVSSSGLKLKDAWHNLYFAQPPKFITYSYGISKFLEFWIAKILC